MVNPVNGDKSISLTTDRPGASAKNARSEQAAVTPSPGPEAKTSAPLGTTLEVDDALQLYNLENQPPRVSGAGISSSEEARSLLDRILEQISAQPGQALKAQGSQAAAPLANLLKTAPV